MYEGLDYDLAEIMPMVVDSGVMKFYCNIMQPDGIFDTGGAPSGNYIPVAGLQGIIAMRGPMSMGKFGGSEQDSIERQQTTQPWHVLLDSYYPTLDGHTEYQAKIWPITGTVADAIDHKIISIESGSQNIMTRIWVEEVTE